MIPQLRIGEPLPPETWWEVRKRAAFECFKWDLQSEDRDVLAGFPLILARKEWEFITGLSERLAAEVLEAEKEISIRPDLIHMLGLPRPIANLYRRFDEQDGCAQVARVMRFDFHFTDAGWRISEVNSDVPGGFIEAGGFTRTMAEHYAGLCAPPDPALAYADSLAKVRNGGSLISMVHATGYSDDHQVMQCLGGHLASRGWKAVMLSPSHLRWQGGRAAIDCDFAVGQPDAIVRFFPGEWLPELREATRWEGYFRRSRTPQSNPGISLVSQSKRLPLVWDQLKLPMTTWRMLLPETRQLRDVSRKRLDDWVLKPALGRVGDDVAIAGITESKAFSRIVQEAFNRPKGWIAQRRFLPVPVAGPERPLYPCLGVFTIDGLSSGVYGRVAARPLIDGNAQDIAVLLDDQRGTSE